MLKADYIFHKMSSSALEQAVSGGYKLSIMVTEEDKLANLLRASKKKMREFEITKKRLQEAYLKYQELTSK